MATRSYVSSIRAAAAAGRRNQVMDAAARLLREQTNFAAFSLDSVAKAAGVTRLTVYNQFGSRRGLLEVLFDDLAELRIKNELLPRDIYDGSFRHAGALLRALLGSSGVVGRTTGPICRYGCLGTPVCRRQRHASVQHQ